MLNYIPMIFNNNKIIKILIRLASVCMTLVYFYEIRDNFAYLPLTFILATKWIIISILCNIGLWFITLNSAKKYKVIAVILYLPTVFISPMTTSLYGWLGAALFFALSILILIKFFPWSKK